MPTRGSEAMHVETKKRRLFCLALGKNTSNNYRNIHYKDDAKVKYPTFPMLKA